MFDRHEHTQDDTLRRMEETKALVAESGRIRKDLFEFFFLYRNTQKRQVTLVSARP